jgi:hypothetical protein
MLTQFRHFEAKAGNTAIKMRNPRSLVESCRKAMRHGRGSMLTLLLPHGLAIQQVA